MVVAAVAVVAVAGVVAVGEVFVSALAAAVVAVVAAKPAVVIMGMFSFSNTLLSLLLRLQHLIYFTHS